jgi:hypothetical protein
VNCLFCERPAGNGVKISKEHIFGDWTTRVLPPQPPKRSYRSSIFNPRTGEMERNDYKAPVPLLQTQVRGPCEDCNGGWMNDQEMAVKPYAKHLFYGRDLHMSPDLASTIATWISKSSMVRDAQDDKRVQAVTQDRRNWIRTRLTPPPGTWVWIACLHVDHALTASRHHTRYRATALHLAEPLVANAFVSTFSFHRLVLFVAGCPPGVGAVYDPSALFPETILRIWPDPAPCHWPPRRTISDELVAKLCDGEGIFSPPAQPPA